jgi:DMSO reductase anchor subunit
MKPAFSVILLTTLIGAGQGLFLALFTAESYAAFGLLPAAPAAFHAGGAALALLLLVAGLAASFFHLGHPERAWRSATQWRTSWLSREVIALPAFMAAVAAYALVHGTQFNPIFAYLPSGTPVTLSSLIGIAATALAFALFLCTAMIYACLRFLREWHTPLTPLNYILLGGCSGFTLAAALAALQAPPLAPFLAGWAIILTALAFAGRAASLWRNARLRPRSTLQTAIGIKHPRIVQKSAGFLGAAFNTREFFHGQPQQLVDRITAFYVATVFVLPLALLAYAFGLGGAPKLPLLLAVLLQGAGLIGERWCFFAQASHPQNLYYQCNG